MKFDLSPFSEEIITKATLRLLITDASKDTFTIKQVSDTNWSENLITYNNRPALGSVLTNFTATQASITYDIDITTAVKANLGKTFSIGIDSSGTNNLGFNAKEAADGKPQLILTFQSL